MMRTESLELKSDNLTCPEMEKQMRRMTLSGHLALYVRWDQRRCTPPATPNPPAKYRKYPVAQKQQFAGCNRPSQCEQDFVVRPALRGCG
jgi:hypothetical protein